MENNQNAQSGSNKKELDARYCEESMVVSQSDMNICEETLFKDSPDQPKEDFSRKNINREVADINLDSSLNNENGTKNEIDKSDAEGSVNHGSSSQDTKRVNKNLDVQFSSPIAIYHEYEVISTQSDDTQRIHSDSESDYSYNQCQYAAQNKMEDDENGISASEQNAGLETDTAFVENGKQDYMGASGEYESNSEETDCNMIHNPGEKSNNDNIICIDDTAHPTTENGDNETKLVRSHNQNFLSLPQNSAEKSQTIETKDKLTVLADKLNQTVLQEGTHTTNANIIEGSSVLSNESDGLPSENNKAGTHVEILSKEATSEDVINKAILSREARSEDVINGDMLSGEARNEDVINGDMLSEEAGSEDGINGDILCEEARSEDGINGAILSEEAGSEDGINGAILCEEAGSEDVINGAILSAEAGSEDGINGDILCEEARSEDGINGAILSEEAGSEDGINGAILCEEAGSEDVINGAILSAEAGSEDGINGAILCEEAGSEDGINEAILSKGARSEDVINEAILSEEARSGNEINESILSKEARSGDVINRVILNEEARSEDVINRAILSESEEARSEDGINGAILSEEARSDEVNNGVILSEEVKSGAVINKVILSKEASEDVINGDMLSGEARNEDVINGDILCEEASCEDVINGAILCEEAGSEDGINEAILSKEARSEDVINGAILSEEARSGNEINEAILSKEARSGDVINRVILNEEARSADVINGAIPSESEEARSEDSINGAILSEDARNDEVINGVILSKEERSEDVINEAILSEEARCEDGMNGAKLREETRSENGMNGAILSKEARCEDVIHEAILSEEARCEDVINDAILNKEARCQDVINLAIFSEVARSEDLINGRTENETTSQSSDGQASEVQDLNELKDEGEQIDMTRYISTDINDDGHASPHDCQDTYNFPTLDCQNYKVPSNTQENNEQCTHCIQNHAEEMKNVLLSMTFLKECPEGNKNENNDNEILTCDVEWQQSETKKVIANSPELFSSENFQSNNSQASETCLKESGNKTQEAADTCLRLSDSSPLSFSREPSTVVPNSAELSSPLFLSEMSQENESPESIYTSKSQLHEKNLPQESDKKSKFLFVDSDDTDRVPVIRDKITKVTGKLLIEEFTKYSQKDLDDIATYKIISGLHTDSSVSDLQSVEENSDDMMNNSQNVAIKNDTEDKVCDLKTEENLINKDIYTSDDENIHVETGNRHQKRDLSSPLIQGTKKQKYDMSPVINYGKHKIMHTESDNVTPLKMSRLDDHVPNSLIVLASVAVKEKHTKTLTDNEMVSTKCLFKNLQDTQDLQTAKQDSVKQRDPELRNMNNQNEAIKHDFLCETSEERQNVTSCNTVEKSKGTAVRENEELSKLNIMESLCDVEDKCKTMSGTTSRHICQAGNVNEVKETGKVNVCKEILQQNIEQCDQPCGSQGFITAAEYLSQSSQESETEITLELGLPQTETLRKKCAYELSEEGFSEQVNQVQGQAKIHGIFIDDNDEHQLLSPRNDQLDIDELDAYVEAAIDQMVPTGELQDGSSNVPFYAATEIPVYTCDVDIIDTQERQAVCKQSDDKGMRRQESTFKWKYAPSFDEPDLQPLTELDDEDQVIQIRPLKTCGKPLRLGLSKKQPVGHLHKLGHIKKT